MHAASTAGSAATGSSCRGWACGWRSPGSGDERPGAERGEEFATTRNPLPVLERWKLLDNLRRSLVPPALLVLLVLGWTVLPGSPGFWTATALAVFALPFFQSSWASSSVASAADRWKP